MHQYVTLTGLSFAKNFDAGWLVAVVHLPAYIRTMSGLLCRLQPVCSWDLDEVA